MNKQEYAGFWVRVGAAIIDTIFIMIITLPLVLAIYGEEYWTNEAFIIDGWDFTINYVLPAAAVILFWIYKSATPGKMAIRLTIVDANTGDKPSKTQFIIRYLGYFVSTIPLFLGLIWVAVDKRKQGWHDKIAGTVVLRKTSREPVQFNES